MTPLHRDPHALASAEFDVLIIGAGIFGACAAWDAALRGLSVALIEREDFCAGASAHSFKMVHGGIRYIQHLDFMRVRGSCHERSALLRIAPHLVQPLPIAIPTYGWGASGKPFLGAGMYLYDIVTADRNRDIKDPARRVPWSRMLTARETRDMFPGLPDRGLTGSAVFHDAQMYNPTRLALAFVQSAAGRGAVVCNHVEADGFRLEGNRVAAVRAHDRLTGDRLEIRARTVLATAGPWTEKLLATDTRLGLPQPGVYSRDACFLVPRRFDHPAALAVLGQTSDPDAVMSRGGRHLFVVPWRDFSLIGVWHKVVPPDPDTTGLTDPELQAFIDEMNASYPAIDLSLDEVTQRNWGLVPFGENEAGAADLRYGKRSRLIDHANTHGIDNLVSLTGIRYTMGRGDAERAMRVVAAKLGADPRSPATDALPVQGGDFTNFESLVRELGHAAPAHLPDGVLRGLAHNYGSNAIGLLANADETLQATIGTSNVLRVEVINAVKNEMARSLEDIVFRRTDLATGRHPGRRALQECATLAAGALGWDADETARQIGAVEARSAQSAAAVS